MESLDHRPGYSHSQLLTPSQSVVLGEDLPLKRDDAAKAATQKRRMALYERVNVLHEQGYSLAQIFREMQQQGYTEGPTIVVNYVTRHV